MTPGDSGAEDEQDDQPEARLRTEHFKAIVGTMALVHTPRVIGWTKEGAGAGLNFTDGFQESTYTVIANLAPSTSTPSTLMFCVKHLPCFFGTPATYSTYSNPNPSMSMPSMCMEFPCRSESTLRMCVARAFSWPKGRLSSRQPSVGRTGVSCGCSLFSYAFL